MRELMTEFNKVLENVKRECADKQKNDILKKGGME